MSRNESVIRWMEQASPEEIGDALLAVSTEKTAHVIAYLASKFGPEAGAQIDRIVERVERDPVKSLGRAALAGLGRLLGDD